jgi:hypothetical protein
MLNRDPASWPPFPGPDAPEAVRLRWAVERFLPENARTTPAPLGPAMAGRGPAPIVAPAEPLSSAPTWVPARLYAFPWPNALPGLGPRRVQPFDLCADCGAGSWAAYGSRVCCLACARRRAADAAQ